MGKRTRFATIIWAGLAAVTASQVAAQDPFNGGTQGPPAAPVPLQDTYGTIDYVNYTIAAWGFIPRAGDAALYSGLNLLRSRTGGDPFQIAAVQIPNGAVVLGTEVEGCDDSTGISEDLETWLVVCAVPATVTGCTLFAGGRTTGAPGCVLSFGAFSPPIVIDNQANTYFVQHHLGAANSLNRFRAVRVRYQLRVSLPPATATFTDVPIGHPQRQFVEALYAAGITGGCTASTYCPDLPLTRGQMAVFLATALGLHFPH